MSLTDLEIGGLLKNAGRIATALEHIAAALGNPVPARDLGPVQLPAGPVHSSPPVGT